MDSYDNQIYIVKFDQLGDLVMNTKNPAAFDVESLLIWIIIYEADDGIDIIARTMLKPPSQRFPRVTGADDQYACLGFGELVTPDGFPAPGQPANKP